jgi:hypothetical protein
MTTLLLTLFFACGDKEEETQDTATEEVVEETTEDTSSEETEDTGSSEETEEETEETETSEFRTNDELGVCYP